VCRPEWRASTPIKESVIVAPDSGYGTSRSRELLPPKRVCVFSEERSYKVEASNAFNSARHGRRRPTSLSAKVVLSRTRSRAARSKRAGCRRWSSCCSQTVV